MSRYITLLIDCILCFYYFLFFVIEMENEYGEHERRATDIASEIDTLANTMEEHLRAIRKIEEYHRTCNS